eukprot:14767-Heterococcus_DN1.PRE.3
MRKKGEEKAYKEGERIRSNDHEALESACAPNALLLQAYRQWCHSCMARAKAVASDANTLYAEPHTLYQERGRHHIGV